MACLTSSIVSIDISPSFFLGGRQRAWRWLNVPSGDDALFFGGRTGTRPGFQGGVDSSYQSVYFS
jgi:hypothetical protein